MPFLDYKAIRAEVVTVLKADSDLTALGLNVFNERELQFSAELTPAAFVYLERRLAPDDVQRMAAGTRTDFHLQFSIWCTHFSLIDIQQAADLRDEVVAKVETALMRKRTLNGKVIKLWLTGGEFFLARDERSGFHSIGEVGFTAHAQSTTT